MVLSTTTFVDSVQSNRMLIREWTRINKLVLSTTTFVDSVQSNRMLIREWTRIDKLCRPKQEKQQIIRWDTSSHINKFVDQQDGSNNQIVVSVPTSTSGVVPNRQNAARQLYRNFGYQVTPIELDTKLALMYINGKFGDINDIS